jgi:ATP-dependent DNA helicase RecQ
MINLQTTLEKFFGFSEFREPQEEVIERVLAGDDVFVLMPTGGGKSLCYQLPALLLEGLTVVVSPLIALMKDQVDGLQERGIPATFINSTLPLPEQLSRIQGLKRGDYRLVYIAPERFRSRTFVRALGEVSIALFAIDEAHCVSQWGHDFRPDYYRLGSALDQLGRPRVGAFTATATPEVREDVIRCLGLQNPRVFVGGFARPNLRFIVTETRSENEKIERLRDLIQRQKTGIVYCATRKRVDQVTDLLAASGIRAVRYHGGIDDAERADAHDQFAEDRCDVVVATNAFGMGIDRADLRFVAHFEMPGSLEAYYQEAGRAGRDGEPAICELFFNFADTRIHEFFIEGNNPSEDLIWRLYLLLKSLGDEQGEVAAPVTELAARLDSENNEMSVHSSLTVLERAGVIERVDRPGRRSRLTRLLQRDLRRQQLPLDRKRLVEKERRDRSKLKAVVDYAAGRECRQQVLLRYLGDLESSECACCDVCTDRFARDMALPLTLEQTTVVRKALSGVARMSFRRPDGYQPRFGRGRIIQALLGKLTPELAVAGIDRLSTFGLLRNESARFLYQLFREFELAGLLQVTSGQFPTITLSPVGVAVMQGQSQCELAWPKATQRRSEKVSAAVSPESEYPIDEGLFQALRRKRSELAQQSGNLPAYLIFADETLRAFARWRPDSVAAARRIRGVGEIKAEKFVPYFLEVIREHSGPTSPSGDAEKNGTDRGDLA